MPRTTNNSNYRQRHAKFAMQLWRSGEKQENSRLFAKLLLSVDAYNRQKLPKHVLQPFKGFRNCFKVYFRLSFISRVVVKAKMCALLILVFSSTCHCHVAIVFEKPFLPLSLGASFLILKILEVVFECNKTAAPNSSSWHSSQGTMLWLFCLLRSVALNSSLRHFAFAVYEALWFRICRALRSLNAIIFPFCFSTIFCQRDKVLI